MREVPNVELPISEHVTVLENLPPQLFVLPREVSCLIMLSSERSALLSPDAVSLVCVALKRSLITFASTMTRYIAHVIDITSHLIVT
jgi:hypothetical protein